MTAQVLLSNYASLAAADSAAVSAVGILVIDINVTLTANTNLSAKLVQFAGGVVTTGSYSFTCNAIDAGHVQIFDLAGTGLISVAGKQVKARWFGAFTGQANETNAWARACAVDGNCVDARYYATSIANIIITDKVISIVGAGVDHTVVQAFSNGSGQPTLLVHADSTIITAPVIRDICLRAEAYPSTPVAGTFGVVWRSAAPTAIWRGIMDNVLSAGHGTNFFSDCDSNNGENFNNRWSNLSSLSSIDAGFYLKGVYNKFDNLFATVVLGGYGLISRANASQLSQITTSGKITHSGGGANWNSVSIEWDNTTGSAVGSGDIANDPAYPAFELNGSNTEVTRIQLSGIPSAKSTYGLYIVGDNQHVDGLIVNGTNRPTNDYGFHSSATGTFRGDDDAPDKIIFFSASLVGSIGTGQIAFPATENTSSDANTLDDYEEGTFTPALTFGGGNAGITYVSRAGRYTKMGNRVAINLYLQLSSKGSSTGTALVTGLPFTSATGGTYASGSGYLYNVSSSFVTPQFYVRANAADVAIENLSAGVSSPVTNTHFTNGSEIMFQTVYEAS